MSLENDIKNRDKLVIGTKEIMKKSKKIKTVYVSSNYDENLFADLNVIKVKQNSEELGALLKKPFLISAIGILK